MFSDQCKRVTGKQIAAAEFDAVRRARLDRLPNVKSKDVFPCKAGADKLKLERQIVNVEHEARLFSGAIPFDDRVIKLQEFIPFATNHCQSADVHRPFVHDRDLFRFRLFAGFVPVKRVVDRVKHIFRTDHIRRESKRIFFGQFVIPKSVKRLPVRFDVYLPVRLPQKTQFFIFPHGRIDGDRNAVQTFVYLRYFRKFRVCFIRDIFKGRCFNVKSGGYVVVVCFFLKLSVLPPVLRHDRQIADRVQIFVDLSGGIKAGNAGQSIVDFRWFLLLSTCHCFPPLSSEIEKI